MVHVALPGHGRVTLSVEGPDGVLANWAGPKFTVNDPDEPYLREDASKSSAPAGPIIIDTEYPHSFRYSSGERFFPMGDTAYVLLGSPKDVIAHYIDVRRAHKFNFIRMMAAPMATGLLAARRKNRITRRSTSRPCRSWIGSSITPPARA